MSEFQSLVSVYYSPRVILQMFSCTVNAYKTACLITHKMLSAESFANHSKYTSFWRDCYFRNNWCQLKVDNTSEDVPIVY